MIKELGKGFLLWMLRPFLVGQVEELIMTELERAAKDGFTSTAIEAAVNSIEFGLRENNTGSFPRGLSLMLRSMAHWIYDRDPLGPLEWTSDLEKFKVPSFSVSPFFAFHCFLARSRSGVI